MFIIKGMFAMTFADENGDRLAVPGEITFSYPLENFGNGTDLAEIIVWSMNPTTGTHSAYFNKF